MKTLGAISFLLFCPTSECWSNAAFRLLRPPAPCRSVVSLEASPGKNSRREFLSENSIAAVMTALLSSGAILPLSSPSAAIADDNSDLTTQMFNVDGSLKEGVESTAKFRTIAVEWDASDEASLAVNVDGSNSPGTKSSINEGERKVVVSYDLPVKWETKNGFYFDTEKQAVACDHIYVYRSPIKTTQEQLQNAATTGVGKALNVIDELGALRSADLVSGRTSKKNDLLYYSFDLAVAPATCGPSEENLGLGFCPYNSIYLLSATVLNECLYVFALECNKSEWKKSNSDLKGIRSSFIVQGLP